MNAIPVEAKRKGTDLGEVELWMVVRYPTWVFGTELRSSARAVNVLTSKPSLHPMWYTLFKNYLYYYICIIVLPACVYMHYMNA